MFHKVLKKRRKNSFELHWSIIKMRSKHVTDFGHLLGKTAPLSYKAFSYTNVHAKYSSHIVYLSSWRHLSPKSSFFAVIQKNIMDFLLLFSGVSASMGRPERGAWIATFKLTKDWAITINGCVRCALMIHIPFLCLYWISFRQKAMFNQNMKLSSAHCFQKKTKVMLLKMHFVKKKGLNVMKTWH